MITIWHNPRCSKSRQTLALLQDRGWAPDIRLYLTDPPNTSQIRQTLDMLGIPAIEMMRTSEKTFKTLNLRKDSAEETLITAMTENPILIERPIVFANARAAIGRPPESVLDILWLASPLTLSE